MWNDGKGHDEAFMIRLQAAFAFIRENNLHALPLGRYDLENGVFAIVQEYFTKEVSQSMVSSLKSCEANMKAPLSITRNKGLLSLYSSFI